MDFKLKTVIADYSDTQRRLITHLVENHGKLTLIGSSENARETEELLEKTSPDLLLLDIEIPHLNGFNLLYKLGPNTQVILITSETCYALRAFDHGVTDYLLKPVRISRFTQAIKKALFNYNPGVQVRDEAPSIEVKSDHELKKIQLSDIKWIEALGDYVKIITRYDKILVHSTLTALEDQLPRDKFLRIHRSYIVNLNKVENFSSRSVEVAGSELPMSRKRKSGLEQVLSPVL